MKSRLEQELELLQHHYGEVDLDPVSGWFHIRAYPVPPPCQPTPGPVAFQVSPAFPGANPYGFAVPASLRFDGKAFPANQPPSRLPFPGEWSFLSWQPENWMPTADLLTGSNLWGWARGFATRLREGP